MPRIVTRHPHNSPQALDSVREFGDAVKLNVGGKGGEVNERGVVGAVALLFGCGILTR